MFTALRGAGVAKGRLAARSPKCSDDREGYYLSLSVSEQMSQVIDDLTSSGRSFRVARPQKMVESNPLAPEARRPPAALAAR